MTVRLVSEEEKLNVETQEKIRFLIKPSEMQANRKLFQGRCTKEMPSKARKQEKCEARKQEECPEQKSQQIQERDARKSLEELANANMKMQETSTRKYVDASPGLARKHYLTNMMTQQETWERCAR